MVHPQIWKIGAKNKSKHRADVVWHIQKWKVSVSSLSSSHEFIWRKISVEQAVKTGERSPLPAFAKRSEAQSKPETAAIQQAMSSRQLGWNRCSCSSAGYLSPKRLRDFGWCYS